VGAYRKEIAAGCKKDQKFKGGGVLCSEGKTHTGIQETSTEEWAETQVGGKGGPKKETLRCERTKNWKKKGFFVEEKSPLPRSRHLEGLKGGNIKKKGESPPKKREKTVARSIE